MAKVLLILCAFICSNVFALTLHSGAFSQTTSLPAIYTCDGKDISPELDWSNIPEKTKSFALIMSDPDAPNGTFYHWVVFNIPKEVLSLPEGIDQYPESVLVGKNQLGKNAYHGPCPPPASRHRYIFTLYALDKTLDLKADVDAQKVLEALTGHILEVANIQTTYGH